MSAEEVGAYIRLLCYQWDTGSVPDNDAAICRLAGCSKSCLPILRKKFTKQPDGLKNRRLEEVRDEQTANREAKIRAGQISAAKRWHSRPINTPIADPLTEGVTESNSPSPTPSPTEYRERHAHHDSDAGYGPSEAEWVARAKSLCPDWPAEDARSAWRHYASIGWEKKGSRIKNWVHALTSCANHYKNGTFSNGGKTKDERPYREAKL